MFSKKILAPVLIAIALIATSCASTNPITDRREVAPERNILTGEIGANGKVIAVKFDDTKAAHPQEGVEAADVVFVTQVEAGLTRLMGIYTSTYPDQVGPVRSARISDVDILAQFGRVGFLYSGAQTKLRPVLSAANLENLSAERNPPSIYFSDPKRIPPYAMMVRIPLLLEKAENVDRVKSIGWKHGEVDPSAQPIEAAKITWPNASYEAVWNKSEKRFVLNFDGAPKLTTTGAQLGSNMMVIQLVKISPSEYGDKFGGVTPKSSVVGEGSAYLLRNGSVTKALWKRASASEPTQWLIPKENGDTDLQPAFFAPGQVWFFLTDEEPKFTYRVSSQSPSPSN